LDKNGKKITCSARRPPCPSIVLHPCWCNNRVSSGPFYDTSIRPIVKRTWPRAVFGGPRPVLLYISLFLRIFDTRCSKWSVCARDARTFYEKKKKTNTICFNLNRSVCGYYFFSSCSIFFTMSTKSESVIFISVTGFNNGGPSGKRFFTSLIDLYTPRLLSFCLRSLGQYRRTDDT
jgi:hypothetical protein